jgi:hypothetical protein
MTMEVFHSVQQRACALPKRFAVSERSDRTDIARCPSPCLLRAVSTTQRSLHTTNSRARGNAYVTFTLRFISTIVPRHAPYNRPPNASAEWSG